MQALHALNEGYSINEKGALKAVDDLALRPDNFVSKASAVLSRPGDSPNRLRVSLENLEHLTREARALCVDLLANG